MVSTSHGAFKERLAEGLAVHIRHGLRRSNRAFCSRLELRWSQMEPEAAPLAICEVGQDSNPSPNPRTRTRTPTPTRTLTLTRTLSQPLTRESKNASAAFWRGRPNSHTLSRWALPRLAVEGSAEERRLLDLGLMWYMHPHDPFVRANQSVGPLPLRPGLDMFQVRLGLGLRLGLG